MLKLILILLTWSAAFSEPITGVPIAKRPSAEYVLLDNLVYKVGYSTTHKAPLWTSYIATAPKYPSHLRPSNFRPDHRVKSPQTSIWTGPIFNDTPAKIKGVAVPVSFYKIAYGGTYTNCYLFHQDDNLAVFSQQGRTTLDQIETLTGLKFINQN